MKIDLLLNKFAICWVKLSVTKEVVQREKIIKEAKTLRVEIKKLLRKKVL